MGVRPTKRWTEYPLRRVIREPFQPREHVCRICGRPIEWTTEYYDGQSRRAHKRCGDEADAYLAASLERFEDAMTNIMATFAAGGTADELAYIASKYVDPVARQQNPTEET